MLPSGRACGPQVTERKWTLTSTTRRTGPVCSVPSRSVMSDSATPRTVACQDLLAMRLSRQEYRSGLPFLPPGDLPKPRTEPASACISSIAGRFFTLKGKSFPKPPGETLYPPTLFPHHSLQHLQALWSDRAPTGCRPT